MRGAKSTVQNRCAQLKRGVTDGLQCGWCPVPTWPNARLRFLAINGRCRQILFLKFLTPEVLNTRPVLYFFTKNHSTVAGSTVCAQRSHSRPHTLYLTHFWSQPPLSQPYLTPWLALCCGDRVLSVKIFMLSVIAVNCCANLHAVT